MDSPHRVRIIHARRLLKDAAWLYGGRVAAAAVIRKYHRAWYGDGERDSVMQVRRLTPDNTRHGVCV